MDFIKISYTGRVKDGRIFDTTDEETAKKEKIYDSKRVYKPVPVIVGEKQVVDGLDEALKSLKVGEKKTVEILPEKAYGQRRPEMVRLVPIKFFKDQKINPIPGLPVEIDGMPARIQTVAGGRVRVDFNSDLAGKTVVFDVEVTDKAKNDEEKVRYLLERSFSDSQDFEVKLEATKLALGIPENAQHDRNILARKASFAAEAFKYLSLDEVKFEEVWKNPKAQEKKAEKKDAQEKSEKKKK